MALMLASERDYMAEFPLELLIDGVSSDKSSESVLCNSYLRVIPGRREVYDGVWDARSVVVKVFSRGIGAAGRLRREMEGLRRLDACGVNTPRLLFYGKTPDGRLAVVTEKIVDSPTIMDALSKAKTKTEQADLLVRLCRQLAGQHIKGVLQKDFHLGNFLIDDKKIYALDPGQMRFLGRAVGRRTSISQLALLARSLPADDAESVSRLAKEYFTARRWSFEKADEAEIKKQMRLHTKRTVAKQLRKCVRTSKRKLRVKTSRHLAVFDRAFCRGAQPQDFLEQIDDLMDKGQILKAGNTCHVSRLTWNGRDVVVKRYNHKGFIHSLRHTIKGSRARHSWRNAHRLGVLQIATAKPVAYIEELEGLLVRKSYLVTEYVEGQQLNSFLQNTTVSNEHRSAAIRRVLDMLGRLQGNRITHSDLKHSNILITDYGPVLIDLDAMQTHKLAWMARRQGRKYMERFKKSLEDAPSR
jgi:tRNA A-37 threonylcarbamoyl transferase component Bud32